MVAIYVSIVAKNASTLSAQNFVVRLDVTISKMNKYTEYAIEAERRVPAIDAANYYGLELNHKDFINCPFHNEKTASFYAKGSFFYCYGCGWHGNVIDFVKDYFGLPFMESLKKVNNDFRLGFPLDHKPSFAEQRQNDRKRAERELTRAIETLKENARQALWDEWIQLDKDRIAYVPTRSSPNITDQYANALKRIDYIGYLIDRFEEGERAGTNKTITNR